MAKAIHQLSNTESTEIRKQIEGKLNEAGKCEDDSFVGMIVKSSRTNGDWPNNHFLQQISNSEIT